MEKLKKLDDRLYGAKHFNYEDAEQLWNEIKNNREVLELAIKPTKDKLDNCDTVGASAICESILVDYDGVPEDIYQKFIDLIYSNREIARIVPNGYYNGGDSFLLLSLLNPKLKLTEDQKVFAVDEAMNKRGTTRYEDIMNKRSEELDEKGITDEKTVFVEMGGAVNPIGEKSAAMYTAGLFDALSHSQAHGLGIYDIRYWILRNPNWTRIEKQQLVIDFWAYDEEYDELLEEWEWGIINDSDNLDANSELVIEKDTLYEITCDELLERIANKEEALRLWNEIEFCKLMHEIRPEQWEESFVPKRVTE